MYINFLVFRLGAVYETLGLRISSPLLETKDHPMLLNAAGSGTEKSGKNCTRKKRL
jgi:hypothetical protein